MSRRALPYVAVGPIREGTFIAPVGTAPTVATRSHWGWQAFLGLVQWGTKRGRVPIQHPFSGQGATWPAFPFVTGSSVAPDSIRPALLVARNLYSPSGHSNPLERVLPAMAESPRVLRRPPQTQSGRPAGAYTLDQPISATWWPTSQQWLANRINNPLPSQPASGWASQRVQSQ